MPTEYSKYEESYWWSKVRRLIVLDCVKEYLSKNGGVSNKDVKLLDVGCGSGVNINLLASLGSAYGVDLSEYEVKRARKAVGGRVAICDCEIFSFKSGTFDAITMLDVLEHLYGPDNCLKDAARILKDGAVVILTVPAYQFLYNPVADEDHRKRYCAKEVRKLVEDAGLEVLKLTYFNTFLFPLMLAQRLVQKHFFTKPGGAGERFFPKYPGYFEGFFDVVFRLERFPLKHINLPCGGSILCISRKP